MDRIISILGIFSIIMFFIGLGKLNYNKLNKVKKFKTIVTRTSTDELVNPTPPSITFNKLFSNFASIFFLNCSEKILNLSNNSFSLRFLI